jgi:hypothetical protein
MPALANQKSKSPAPWSPGRRFLCLLQKLLPPLALLPANHYYPIRNIKITHL